MQILQRLTDALGEAPIQITPLGGGCIASVYQLQMPGHQTLVAKVAGPSGTLDIEAGMLRYLSERTTLPVPKVVHAQADLLILRHMPGRSSFDAGAQRHAAKLLAGLHSITSTRFGFERDTIIGSLPQPNPQAPRWIDFFRDHRLLHMARSATNGGRLDPALFDRIQRLADRLPCLLIEPDHPSLIHGDVWTTNVLADGDRITAFLDPAIYYADAEVELAFITLFNTFGKAFFDAYHESRPIKPGFFEVRRDVYNLYPLLVHVRLFGGGYADRVAATLTRLGF